jgi:hypothetical protein
VSIHDLSICIDHDTDVAPTHRNAEVGPLKVAQNSADFPLTTGIGAILFLVRESSCAIKIVHLGMDGKKLAKTGNKSAMGTGA